MPNNDEYDPICELCPHRLADHEKDDDPDRVDCLICECSFFEK